MYPPAKVLIDEPRLSLDSSVLLKVTVAYSAENAYYRCITPPAQYLYLQPFKGDLCKPGFVSKLAAFVNATPPAVEWRVEGCSGRTTRTNVQKAGSKPT